MKKLAALLLAGLMTISLAACSLPGLRPAEQEPEPTPAEAPGESAAPEPLRLRLAIGEEVEGLDDALERLRAARPDLAVERVTEEAGADLLLLGAEEIAAAAAAGRLAELPELPDGGLCARPAQTLCLLINDAAFTAAGIEPPQTAAELPDAAAALSARGGEGLLLCQDDDTTALAFLEGALEACGADGVNALLDGTAAPHDEAVLRAAELLCRLGRGGAVRLLPRGEAEERWRSGGAGAFFAPDGTAGPDGALRRLPWGSVCVDAGAFLAVSAASGHRTEAADAARFLSEYLSAYERRAGGAPEEYRETLTELTTLAPEDSPALASALADGVRELLRGAMIPDEFAESAALTLDARP